MHCPLNATCRAHPVVSTNTVSREHPNERCTERASNPLNPQHLHLNVLPDRNALPDSLSSPPKRLLATMLFTDLVGSTELALNIGDESWGMVVSNHYTLSLAELDRFNGRLVRKTGDGVVALFDSPVICEYLDGLHGDGAKTRLRYEDVAALAAE